ncbi:MAG: hypothetical protein ACP5UN_01345 [Candidatus Micrarchaeia archaeon]
MLKSPKKPTSTSPNTKQPQIRTETELANANNTEPYSIGSGQSFEELKLPDNINIDEQFNDILKDIKDLYKKIKEIDGVVIPDWTLYKDKHLDKNAENLGREIEEKYNKYKELVETTKNFSEFLLKGINIYLEKSEKEINKTLEESKKWKSIENKNNYADLIIDKETQYLAKLFVGQITNIRAIMKNAYKEINRERVEINTLIKNLKEGTILEKIAIASGFKKLDNLTHVDNLIDKTQKNITRTNKVDLYGILGDEFNDLEYHYKSIKHEKTYLKTEMKNNNDKYYKRLVLFKNEFNNILKIRQAFAEFIYEGLDEYRMNAEKQINYIVGIDNRTTNSEIHLIINNYKNQIKIINRLLKAELNDLNKRKDKIDFMEDGLNDSGLKKLFKLVIAYLL